MKSNIAIVLAAILIYFNSVVFIKCADLTRVKENSADLWSTIRATRDVLPDSEKNKNDNKRDMLGFSNNKRHKQEKGSYPTEHKFGGGSRYCK